MTFTTISELPPLPEDGAEGDDFNDPAITFFAALSTLRNEINAVTAQYAAYVTSVLTATSATSLAIGTGSKAFTIGTGYAFVPGQRVKAASLANVANYMEGVVATYTGGVLTVTVDVVGGSGTKTDWQIGLTLNSSLYALLTDLYGVQQIFIPAPGMKARTTAGAAQGSSETTTNKIMVETLDFDASTVEYAQFRFQMPKRWNEGTVTAQFVWTAANTGNVVWRLRAVAISDDDPLDAAFGTEQSVTDGVTAANDVMISAATPAITIGGSPAENDLVVFQVDRFASDAADTCAVDAKLLGVRLIFTTNAKDDS